MDTIQLIYARSHTVGGFLIRLGSWWAPWTHVGIVTPDWKVINARAFHGVVEESWEDFVTRYAETALVTVHVVSAKRVHEWARSQLGSGYDWGSILAFVSRLFGRQSDSRWQCVELVETAIAAGGGSRFRIPLSRVSVQQSYMVI